MTYKIIKTYDELKKFIGTDNFNSLLETSVDLNRDHKINLVLKIQEINSQIVVYDYPKKYSVLIKTPIGIPIVIQINK